MNQNCDSKAYSLEEAAKRCNEGIRLIANTSSEFGDKALVPKRDGETCADVLAQPPR